MGTGGSAPRAEAFLGTPGSPCYPPPQRAGSPSRLTPPPQTRGHGTRIYLGAGPHAWTGQAISPAGLPLCVTPVNTLAYQHGGPPDHHPHRHRPARRPARHPSKRAPAWVSTRTSAWTVHHRYGNINPSSIDYACRPRLRPRLTQGGRTCPWNPWSYGAGESHPGLATHACILTPTPSTRGHPRASPSAGRSPTTPHHQGTGSAASAVRLSPATLSAHDHSTSELLRTLSRMAASEPTSWLSPRPHILSHLAYS